MRREGRYWLFFVIIAVGLALSWGQVGRKTHRALDAEPILYLKTEQPCQPSMAPCAAFTEDRALVIGPAQGGLALRQTGMAMSGIVASEVIFLASGGEEITRRVLTPGEQGWSLTDVPPTAASLRVRIKDDRVTTVAEFPLQPAPTDPR